MKTIYALSKDGKIKKYDVILTYYSDEYDKDYIVYTDNIYNENNELQIYINEYDKDNLDIITTNIEDKEEYNKIKLIVNDILDNMRVEANN